VQEQIVEVEQCCAVVTDLELLVCGETAAIFAASNGMSRPACATSAA